MKLTALPRGEVLRYLGWKGTPIPEPLEETLQTCMKEMLQWSVPRYFYRRLPVSREESGIRLCGTPYFLPGRDIALHLNHSSEVFLLCATIGLQVDRELRRRMVTAPEEALILDACATAAIEEVADQAEKEIEGLCRAEGKGLTWRYSPGYGDLPLETQKWLIPFLDAPRKIGLTVTDSLLMVPGKSVTAILGVTELPESISSEKQAPACNRCPNRDHCLYRKRGDFC